ncbi:MAG: UDP-N-acetylmuramoyl-L-alanyl-D-glutamate--2,6-diaminopimelate ligase [Rubrobacter sp.]|nr:UDP-N-acetylmuramoyl-L-alanyl-D-glutamate--2,6-diaminopimelate ligase [Rubrobacter sp.]
MLDRIHIEESLETPLPPGIEAVSGVTHDSRSVEPGFAFVAVSGFKKDGVEFAAQAIENGASLVVAERKVEGVPCVVVEDAREALARLAAAFHGRPSEAMEVYGVTGTNGKTTTSYALYSILSFAFGEGACGLMTTAETVFGGERRDSVRTTPEATDVQAVLAAMRDGGASRVVMEVSSHGVELKRVFGMKFAAALFTNLTRDHLDLHGSMEEYFRAKRELFLWTDGPKLANADDEWGRGLASEVEGVVTFGIADDADFRVEDVRASGRGTRFVLRSDGEAFEFETPLLGSYNVSNVAGAASLALSVGVDGGDVARAVAEMPQVPGRFERVGGADFEVIVDYAHTDVGLAAVLEVARGVAEIRGGRVVCVFGAAGERDGAKRPLMGKVATEMADESIITTDDAYGESPEKIAEEVAAGANGKVETILDRREAIRFALGRAKPRDVVVVAGKGHERIQHLPEGDVPFHDASVVAEIIEEGK